MVRRMSIMMAGLVAVLALGLSSQSQAREYFTINRFHAEINVHEDNSIVVSESIQLTFHRERHGIYREIPYKYKNELGETIRMPIKVLEVK